MTLEYVVHDVCVVRTGVLVLVPATVHEFEFTSPDHLLYHKFGIIISSVVPVREIPSLVVSECACVVFSECLDNRVEDFVEVFLKELFLFLREVLVDSRQEFCVVGVGHYVYHSWFNPGVLRALLEFL